MPRALKKRKKNNKNFKNKVFTTLIFIFIIWLSIQLFVPNFDILSLYDRFPSLREGSAGLVINADIVSNYAAPKVYENGEILMPLGVISKYIDDTLLLNDDYVIIAAGDTYLRYQINDYKYVVNNKVKKGNVMPLREGMDVFIPIGIIKSLYNLEVKYSEKNNIVMLTLSNAKRSVYEVTKDLKIRENPSIKSMIVGDAIIGEELYVYSKDKNWAKVVTKEGITGYVKTDLIYFIRDDYKDKEKIDIDLLTGETLGEEEMIPNGNSKDEGAKKDTSPKKKISLLWNQVSSKSSNPKVETLKENKAVNVTCFTWFEITNSNGDIRDKVDPNIVKWAHKNGNVVWALVTNPFSDSELSHEMLKSAVARENAIKQMIELVKKYDIDGINVDIESLKEKTGTYYIQFIRELSIFCKNNKITLSLDMYMPSKSTEFYGRKEIGEMVDYFCLMAYDEHWRTSPKEGSVASLPWVEKGIINTLESVDASKILLGMPSYTRRWKIEDGKVTEAEALGMERALNDLISHDAEIVYDEETKQNYGEYTIIDEVTKKEATYKIWLEDDLSVEQRLELADKYNLAGVATWKKGFEKDSIWDYYNDYLTR